MQIDPDGSLGEYLQIYSDSDGKKINRFVSTEWLYGAAVRGTDDSRFKLAHELAHWILHRTAAHTFLRSPRTNRVLSKLHAREEREADMFAREFLMPLAVVEKFTSADGLAKAAQVPLWVARYRWREVSSLTPARRADIRRLAAIIESETHSKLSSDVLMVTPEGSTTVKPTSAHILQFPKITPRSLEKKKKVSSSLPLFDYAEAVQHMTSDVAVTRSDKWFYDFGWRG